MFSDDYTEALFAQAVRDNCQRNQKEDLENKESVEYSQNHIIKMEKLIRDDEKREIRAKIFTWTRRFAATAAAFFVVAGGVLLTIPEVRAAVIGAIQTRTEHYTDFSGEPTEGEFKQWKLGYIPEGFVLDYEIKDNEHYYAAYVNDKNQDFYFLYTLIDNNISTNNEETEYTQVFDNGVLYHLFIAKEDSHASSIIWDNGVQLFRIFGDLSTDELLKIAKNIK
jgi:hypothetical protein